MLQMASVYGVQQTAKHAPAFFLPKCAEVMGCDTLPCAVYTSCFLHNYRFIVIIGAVSFSPLDGTPTAPCWGILRMVHF